MNELRLTKEVVEGAVTRLLRATGARDEQLASGVWQGAE